MANKHICSTNFKHDLLSSFLTFQFTQGPDTRNICIAITHLLLNVFSGRYLLSYSILLLKWYLKYMSKPRPEMKVPDANLFILVLHTHSRSIAIVQENQALPAFVSQVVCTIFKINSVDSCTLPSCDNACFNYTISDWISKRVANACSTVSRPKIHRGHPDSTSIPCPDSLSQTGKALRGYTQARDLWLLFRHSAPEILRNVSFN